MGVWLEIYSCKKDDLNGAQLDADGYDFDIVFEIPQVVYYDVKGDYANARVIHGILDSDADYCDQVLGGYGSDMTVLCKPITRHQLELIDQFLSTKPDDGNLNEFHQAIKDILEKVDFATEEVLFDFA